MADVKRLNEVTKQLEEDAYKIRSIGQLVDDVRAIDKELEINKATQKVLIEELGLVASKVEEVNKLYSKQLDKLLSLVDSVDGKYIDKIEEIRKEVNSYSNELVNINKRIETNIMNILQQSAIENKKLYLELEDVVSSKISRMKSDVEVEIRDSGKNIKENVQKIIQDDVKKISDEFDNYKVENSKVLNKQTILIVVVGIVAVANLIIGMLLNL